MSDMARKLAILYAAKSTADIRDSIGTQLADGRKLAEADGYTVIDEYQDEAKSAYHGSRGDGLVKAREHAAALADEGHDVILVVQHTDRLARGDGKEAQHLAEVVFWARKADVVIRSKQDDYTTENLIMAVVMGERNHEDSKRKGLATAAGHQRTVERGEWRGGILPAGYDVRYEHDERGRITARPIVHHAEDQETYDLIWRLALDGASEQKIGLELNRRGAMTRPVRKGHKRQPFSVGRVSQILNNPFYAGMQPLNGELAPGNWPTYVSFEDFTRLRTEREARCKGTKRRRGRPVEGYLLSELARCATCGSAAQGRSTYTRKKDGVRSRAYVCRAHREHHEDDVHYCPAMPWDAEAVDRAVLGELGRLLSNMDDLRTQLETGQRAEREKLERVVAEATEAAQVAERAAERATAEFADAEDAAERALLKDAAKVKRADAKRAKARADAALDAMTDAEVAEVDPEAAMRALYERLADQLAAAGEDVKVLNAALRESFARFELHGDGRIVPSISPDAAARFARDSEVNLRMSLGDDLLRLPAFVVA
jgi:DNA invertase Pin-like site-specific DNA recombinase